MSFFLRFLAERQIEKAQSDGQLSGIAGEGAPLPVRESSGEDAVSEIGHRVMAEAGAVPAEVQLINDLSTAKRAWQAAITPEEKKVAMARFAELEMRRNMAAERRRRG
ncbi:DnaJ family domain-containing protein [Pelagovum pacificum]|uniref:DUF1992 domain-containing protein n=1 Tax=Pelagovum pacificum TaxID=2588711 RepID=A0A5C5GGR9_9RHOB|nr:DnaJ family domain-containing protein [Pelagovum pacificum]QQA44149.1 DUF1992 domain-containing protein [Pelagovum pacificum]TNY32726.1 DUF1992 domain-containing protein [Pelagovum pacificum]